MVKQKEITTVVVGSLNTDIILTGVKHFAGPGMLSIGKKIVIGPGGKSRNIATMIAALTNKGEVAMVGRTCRDRFGLWKPPYAALVAAGVDTKSVTIAKATKEIDLPGIAMIPVNVKGQNQLYLAMGANNAFGTADLKRAVPAFQQAAKNNGTLVLTMELPFNTALAAVKQAKKFGLRVLLDPGGIDEDSDLSELLSLGIDVVKPNESEAQMLTGVQIKDIASAKRAGQKLLQMGAKSAVITVGPEGAYVFEGSECIHVPCSFTSNTTTRDATGCGDQTMAALASYLQKGFSLLEATRAAMVAGSMQFYRTGIKPVRKSELARSIAQTKKSSVSFRG